MKHSLFILLLLGACSDGLDSPCDEQRVDLPVDGASGYGFTARDVLDFAEGEHQATFSATTAPTTDLVIGVVWQGGPPEWSERVPASYPSAESDSASEPVCADALMVPVELEFTTQDGALRERWQTHLESTEPGIARFDFTIDPGRVRGSFAVDSADYRDQRFHLQGAFTEHGGVSGELTMSATHSQTGARDRWRLASWVGR